MCGFITLIDFKKKKINCERFLKLKSANKHRGPDNISFENNNNNLIIFRRLKIIDLSKKANQPFSKKQANIKLIFNGEIYNYIELRNELKKINVKFYTKSDTEVILNCYLRWGINFVNKLRGMFSIVIFDNRKKKVLFFRDHFGQKPLFYSFYNGGLILSSEIKDIIYLKKSYHLDRKIVDKYLIRGWTDDAKNTFFKDIFSLPAASFGEYSKYDFKIKKYWKIEFGDKEYNSEEFKNIFNENIKLHLRSDVPLAFTLSSGMDSSSILRTALDHNINKYKAFSVRPSYTNEEDESKIIKNFVNKNNLNHQFFKFNYENYENLLEELIQNQDEPINHPSFIYQYLLRKEISNQGFKVILTGEGGDEVFGGYTRMYIPYLIENYLKKNKKIENITNRNIRIISNFKEKLIYRNSKKIFQDFNKFNNDIEDNDVFSILKLDKNSLDKKLRFYNQSNPKKKNYFKNFLLNHITKRDLPSILRQEDRISMSQSIENRSPLVDHKLVEYVFSLNSKHFMKNGITKYILKDLMKDKLPKSFINNKKIGRPGKFDNIIYANYYEKFIDLLNSNVFFSELYDVKKVKEILYKQKKMKNRKFNTTLFRILNLLIWKNGLQEKINF